MPIPIPAAKNKPYDLKNSLADTISDVSGSDPRAARNAVQTGIGAAMYGPYAPAAVVAAALGGPKLGTSFGADTEALYTTLEEPKTEQERQAANDVLSIRTKQLQVTLDSITQGVALVDADNAVIFQR